MRFCRLVGCCLVTATALGCAAIDETHYFATHVEPSPSNPTGVVNIFRMTVNGDAGLANVRYIAGEYDERSVDFFLNEVKAEDYVPSDGQGYGPDEIFRLKCEPVEAEGNEESTCTLTEDGDIQVARLGASGSGDDFDSFVIIMSTNADAIAETIGAFAENTVVIQSVNYLMNQETFRAERTIEATSEVINLERSAVLRSLDQSFGMIESSDAPGHQLELAILQSIAIALEPERAVTFDDIEEAEAWFSSID